MVKVKRVLGLAFIVVLALVLLFGCARLFWGTTGQSGWYIRLNIGSPGSKLRATILNPDSTYWILSEELDTLSSRRDPIYIDEDQKKLFK